MRLVGAFRFGLASVGLGLCLGAAASAGAPGLAVLGRIEHGQWQFKEQGNDASPRTLCIADPAMLIQFDHGPAQCRNFVIANESDLATVHYSCPGTGHGRTTIKLSTPRTFNLDTQGIINGSPFEHHYEARRSGDCSPSTGAQH